MKGAKRVYFADSDVEKLEVERKREREEEKKKRGKEKGVLSANQSVVPKHEFQPQSTGLAVVGWRLQAAGLTKDIFLVVSNTLALFVGH